MASSSASDEKKEPVFLDGSKRRKWYFRTGTVVCFVFVLLGFCLFLFGLSFATGKNTPITYADAIQRYHYYYSAANNNKLALTFDDGPNPPASEQIMNALAADNVTATFFYIGKRALVRPDIVKEAINRGFDVEDHSFTHSYSVDSSYSRLAFELNSTSYLLSQVGGKNISLYRPPYLLGIATDPTINPYIPTSQDMVWSLQLGYLPVGSDIDSKDWLASTPEGVLDGLKHGLALSPNGHIVLFHDDPNTAQAMPQVLAYLKAQGYTIVPLQQLLTPPSNIALTKTLVLGSTDATTGGEVSQLQWFLYTQKYLDPYALTGVFDNQTQTAVINFQTRNHLIDPSNPDAAAVGVVGPATRALIHSISVASDPATAAADMHGWLWNSTLHPLHELVLWLYVNLFPVVRNVLVTAVGLTLLLVVARTLGLLGLLLWRWRYGSPATEWRDMGGVSILIPAYNEQENIAATVESVIACNYRPREILVINDGSTDKTAEEVEAVIAAHPGECVRLITTQNGGKAHALNVGLTEAHNEIIIVLDADAVLDPDAVGYFVPHFADPQMGAVAGKVRTTNASNMLDIFQTLEYAIGQNIDKTAFSTIGAIGVVPGPAGAWRRQFVLEAGGFHTDTLVEDQEMTLTLLHRKKKVAYEARAIAYTETPHTVKNFLKQRFRWVYGTMQCFWKHKSVLWERPDSMMSLVVMPNIFVYNILLPLTYPFADWAFVFGLIFGEWQTLVIPFLVFTVIDLLYATWGLRGEQQKWKLMLTVPLQRVVYRQLLYYTVYRAFIRAIEGTGTSWNKFAKTGETRRFYLAAMGGVEGTLGSIDTVPVPVIEGLPDQLPQLMPEEVMMSFQGPGETALASTNRQEVMSLSVMPRHFQSAGDTSSPAFAPNVLTGVVDDPNTYAKSSSPFGPTSSH